MQQKAPEAVIWIASYPKSGNTWVQTVIRAAGKGHGTLASDIDVYKLMASKAAPEAVSAVRSEISPVPTTVLKTHSGYEEGNVHPELNLKIAGFVYVMRNPLDLLLSYINFTRLQYEKWQASKRYQERLFLELLGFDRVYSYEEWRAMSLDKIPRQNLDHALRRFTELATDVPAMSQMTRGSWLTHCLSWFDAAKNIPGVILRYEDLLKGPEQFLSLQTLFTFTQQEILAAVTTMNERQRGLQHTNIFYNKMSAGYFTEYFSQGVIDAFIKRFEPELSALGYAELGRRAA